MIQSDAWAAYDILSRPLAFDINEGDVQHERRVELLPFLTRFVAITALSRDEIEALPDNYTATAAEHKLPDLFDPASGWTEAFHPSDRLHDHAADFRRAASAFILPAGVPADRNSSQLNDRGSGESTELPDAVALVVLNLLVDETGRVVPSPITYEVQFRRFIKDVDGQLVSVQLSQYELSRKLFLDNPASGGLVAVDEQESVYLPAAGNDYSFASCFHSPYHLNVSYAFFR